MTTLKRMKAWVLWNPKRMQYISDGFDDAPRLFETLERAMRYAPRNDGSSLNAHWKAVRVTVTPIRKSSGGERS